ncbi:MFS transporter [Actinoplanes sp. M2I2]|uniref:MFS transporter n=1 Tax=Actinoplanes sp. M2I2 TaxID=1734444 RepID=UPI002020E163|nr:MFS transporter [Actinoplanes sp. M2I2]
MTSFVRRRAPALRPAPDSRPAGRFRFAVVVIAGAAFITSLTQALVVPVLPALPRELNVPAATAGWLITVTVIVGAVANPLLGRLGDQLGRRRLLLVAIAAFVVGSVVCAVTTDFGVLLAGRAIQGLSTASIPLGIGVIAGIVPPSRRPSGIALVSAMLGVGGAAGLPLAGVLAAGWGLAGVFWTSAVVGAAVLVATALLVPPDARPAGGAHDVDWFGALLLTAGLTTLLIPISQAARWGWGSPATIGLFTAAVLVLLSFSVFELRRRHPIVDLRLAMLPPVLLTNVAGLALGAGFFISFLAAMTLLQLPADEAGGFGRPVIEAGLLMLPGGVAMAVSAPLGARLVSRHGGRAALRVAALAVVLGFAPQLFPREGLWQLVLSTVIVSGGVAVAYSAMPALILAATPAPQAAAASGVNALARNLGSALGSAGFGLLAGATAPAGDGYTTLYLAGAVSATIAFLAAVALPRSRTNLT